MKTRAEEILIIDSESNDRISLEEELQKALQPFHITLVLTLAEAIINLKKKLYKAVISDYMLADGKCTDLIPLLGEVPLIVMSEEGNEEEILMALRSGANDYLVKDGHLNYRKLLAMAVHRSLQQKIQTGELQKYRTQLENIVEERTIELIDMYGKLQESETNFRNIFNSTSDGMVITDYDYNFLEANSAVLFRFGVTKEFLSTHIMMDYLMPDFKPLILEQKERFLKGLPSPNMEIDVRSPIDGTVMSFEINSIPIVFNKKNAILTIMRDIAERKNHARKLFETIIQTEEDERTRIARDLHDEIGPLMSALKIYTNSFLECKNAEKKDKLAAQMGIIIREVIESIKTISNDMSPHVLVNFGLLAAIQNFIELFSKNIRIKLTSNIGDQRFPTTVESLIYRIIKELINNTIKHARASEIFINIEYSNAALVCRYSDNGIGFDWKQQLKLPAKGMGISNIITRIRTLGGELEVHSEHRHGFEINFVLRTAPKDVNDKKEKQGNYRG